MQTREPEPYTRYVLYHGNCADGFGAAWAAWTTLGYSAAYIPVLYGQPLPDLPDGVTVWIVDFSYPRDVLLELKRRYPDLQVLDHHQTAEEALRGLDFCRFDMSKSGAVLAWEHFHPGRPVPVLLKYVQDRDLWQMRLPQTRAVTAWRDSHRRLFETWSGLNTDLETDFAGVCLEGVAALRLQEQQVEIMCRQAIMIDMGGQPVPAANATVFFSDVGERLCQLYPDAPFAAYYLDRADGMRQWGLRSRGDFDVSAVAKLYGGGGHAAAAGFVQEIGCPLCTS